MHRAPAAVSLSLGLALFGCSTSDTGGGGGESLGPGGTGTRGAGSHGDGASSGSGGATSVGVGTGTGVATTAGPGSGTTSGTASSASSSVGTGGVVPPFGASSGGSGGPAPASGIPAMASGVSYDLIIPSSYTGAPTPFLLVYSGTEGHAQMTSNLMSVAPITGTGAFIEAVVDGVTYNGDGAAGATILDAVRAAYNVDDDRTYLLGESAGTSASEQLAFDLRPSYFAAYWANDVNTVAGPSETASALGFAPWGQVGPGGETATADAIVAAMQTAGYRLPTPAPYAGPGAGTHGDPNQFIAAVSFFVGKTRQ